MALLLRILKKIIISPVDWFLYTVLTEEQKKFLANLFTERQKDFLRKFTSMGKNHAQRQKINQLKYYLYNLGFEKRAVEELKNKLLETTNAPFQRALAWELALWHANQLTTRDAKTSLYYLEQAEKDERNQDQLRKIAILKAECLSRLNTFEKARKVINKQLEKQIHPDLLLALANLEKSIDRRLYWLNQTFEYYGLQPICLTEKKEKPYDHMKMATNPKPMTSGPKVSVILPAFNAESGIQTAIESILQQTWKNLELIIVDDCSTDDTVKVVQKYMKKDDRIKFFSTPENSGPYKARNIGLKEATGEFVTVNDADDWSHAEKLEKQVMHLIENPSVIANTSEHARLTETFKLYRRGTLGFYIFPNMSSLMFRRKQVLERIGYWDEVRFAADGEYKRRLIKVFGEQNIVDLKTGPLSLPRQSERSLTGSSAFGYDGYFMGARREYVEAIKHFHQTSDQLYYPFSPNERPFPIPEPMKPTRISPKVARSFDVVIGADFRLLLTHYPTFIEELKQLKQMKIGFINIGVFSEKWHDEYEPEIRQVINGENIQMLVYGEKIKTTSLLLLDHLVLADWQRYLPDVRAEEIFVRIREVSLEERVDGAVLLHHMVEFFSKKGLWIPVNEQALQQVQKSDIMPIKKEKWKDLMHYV